MPTIYTENPDGTITAEEVDHINGYLMAGPDIYVESRTKPLCKVPEMITGNRPADGGNLIIEAKDYADFIERDPRSQKYIKRLIGSEEFINNKERYCLWLVNCPPNEMKSMKLVYERVKACRADRLKGAPDRQKLAATPYLFRETINPKHALVVPAVSGSSRLYVPMDFIDDNTIVTNLVLLIPNADIYLFGILTSSVHMAWMRVVAGRLGISYRYSAKLVYNNFPFITPTNKQRTKIELTAQKILDTRANYPDASLADLYDENTMPRDLRKAHNENDEAVLAAYGYPTRITEEEIAIDLLYRYDALVNG